jgi:hypothetical protein
MIPQAPLLVPVSTGIVNAPLGRAVGYDGSALTLGGAKFIGVAAGSLLVMPGAPGASVDCGDAVIEGDQLYYATPGDATLLPGQWTNIPGATRIGPVAIASESTAGGVTKAILTGAQQGAAGEVALSRIVPLADLDPAVEITNDLGATAIGAIDLKIATDGTYTVRLESGTADDVVLEVVNTSGGALDNIAMILPLKPGDQLTISQAGVGATAEVRASITVAVPIGDGGEWGSWGAGATTERLIVPLWDADTTFSVPVPAGRVVVAAAAQGMKAGVDDVQVMVSDDPAPDIALSFVQPGFSYSLLALIPQAPANVEFTKVTTGVSADNPLTNVVLSIVTVQRKV